MSARAATSIYGADPCTFVGGDVRTRGHHPESIAKVQTSPCVRRAPERRQGASTLAFSEATKQSALLRAGNRCECKRLTHGHKKRCKTRLTRRTAEFHHKTAVASGGSDAPSNCEVLCHACHVQVRRPR